MLMSLTGGIHQDPGPMTSTPIKSSGVKKLDDESSVSDNPDSVDVGASFATLSTANSIIVNPEEMNLQETDQGASHSEVESETPEQGKPSSIPGYRQIPNSPDAQSDDLKQRLLKTLSSMIPHKESLSLRLLINYQIDEKDSECLVIDETLYRQSLNCADRKRKTEQTQKRNLWWSHPETVGEPEGKRRKAEEKNRVLDLSFHNENDQVSVKKLPDVTSEIFENGLMLSEDNCHDSPQALKANVANMKSEVAQSETTNTKVSASDSCNLPSTTGQTQPNGTTVFTTSGLPLLDSSVFALLPLLQQQQQQQNQANIFNHQKLQSFADAISMNPSVIPSDTAGNMLFKELQAFINTNANSSSTLAANASSNLSLTNPNSALFTSNLSHSASTPSLVGLPLFNPFNSDQLTAVQALLPSSQLLNSSLSSPGFSSFNLGSATLLNLKDKQTGLETVSLMPTAKQLGQPILNQMNVPQTTSVSLRTLSHLLNGSVHHKLPTVLTQTTPSNLGGTAKTDGTLEKKIPTDEDYHKLGTTIPMVNSESSVSTPAAAIPTRTDNNVSAPVPYSSSSQFMFGRRLAHTRKFICNQCRVTFASLAELNKHTLEAHNSFKCTICEAHFTQRSNLQRHSLKHVGFKPFTCNLCKKEYYRKDHLVRHIEVTHPNHDPKMNITVHLTSSECLDYLDRVNMGRQTPSPNESDELAQSHDQTTMNIMEIIENAKNDEPTSTELNETSIDDISAGKAE